MYLEERYDYRFRWDNPRQPDDRVASVLCRMNWQRTLFSVRGPERGHKSASEAAPQTPQPLAAGQSSLPGIRSVGWERIQYSTSTRVFAGIHRYAGIPNI